MVKIRNECKKNPLFCCTVKCICCVYVIQQLSAFVCPAIPTGGVRVVWGHLSHEDYRHYGNGYLLRTVVDRRLAWTCSRSSALCSFVSDLHLDLGVGLCVSRTGGKGCTAAWWGGMGGGLCGWCFVDWGGGVGNWGQGWLRMGVEPELVDSRVRLWA